MNLKIYCLLAKYYFITFLSLLPPQQSQFNLLFFLFDLKRDNIKILLSRDIPLIAGRVQSLLILSSLIFKILSLFNIERDINIEGSGGSLLS